MINNDAIACRNASTKRLLSAYVRRIHVPAYLDLRDRLLEDIRRRRGYVERDDDEDEKTSIK